MKKSESNTSKNTKDRIEDIEKLLDQMGTLPKKTPSNEKRMDKIEAILKELGHGTDEPRFVRNISRLKRLAGV